MFKNVPELFILIPVMFNLRGILEQSLAARLSAASSIGVMESVSGRRKIWVGNLNLIMFQSITAGLLAGLMSSLLSWLISGIPLWRCCLMVVVASATSASASLISGMFLFVTVQTFRWLRRSPEGLIGPLTTSFGGVMSLFLLALYAGFFYLWTGSLIGIVAIVASLIGANVYFYSKTRKNVAVESIASEGWPTILFSLLLTGLSGLLLQHFLFEYKSIFALFLPVFNGVTGTFAGIYCSEAISHLHLYQLNHHLPRRTASTILILFNPIQVLLVYFITLTNSTRLTASLLFSITLLLVGNSQILLLFTLSDFLIKIFWKFKIRLETHVPVLMGTIGDLMGTLVLVTAFYVLKRTGTLPIVTNLASSSGITETLLSNAVMNSITETISTAVIPEVIAKILPDITTTTVADKAAAVITTTVTTAIADVVTSVVVEEAQRGELL